MDRGTWGGDSNLRQAMWTQLAGQPSLNISSAYSLRLQGLGLGVRQRAFLMQYHCVTAAPNWVTTPTSVSSVASNPGSALGHLSRAAAPLTSHPHTLSYHSPSESPACSSQLPFLCYCRPRHLDSPFILPHPTVWPSEAIQHLIFPFHSGD